MGEFGRAALTNLPHFSPELRNSNNYTWEMSRQPRQVKAVEELPQVRSIRYSSRYLTILAFGFVVLSTCVAFIHFFRYPQGWDFRNNLYLPIHLLLQHQSPYNIHALVDNSNAVWLPMALGLFLPLGYLDLQRASNLWWLINFGALFALVFITAGHRKPSLLKLIPITFFVYLFPSTIAHLNLGQISILVCLALVVIIFFEKQMPAWSTGFLLAFALTKPQLVLIFIPAYFLKIQRERGWVALWKLGLWTLAGVVIFSSPVVVVQPDWFRDFFLNLWINPPWAHPTIYVLVFSSLGMIGQVFGWIYFCTGLLFALYYTTRVGNKESLLWALALTPVISPYIWSWDFVFLYPLIAYSLFKEKDRFKMILILSGNLLVLVGYIAQKLTGQVDEILSWWVPWGLIAVTLIVHFLPESIGNFSKSPGWSFWRVRR